jgi:hypothetical protein
MFMYRRERPACREVLQSTYKRCLYDCSEATTDLVIILKQKILVTIRGGANGRCAFDQPTVIIIDEPVYKFSSQLWDWHRRDKMAEAPRCIKTFGSMPKRC